MARFMRNRPDQSREQLDRTRELMDKHATDALVRDFPPEVLTPLRIEAQHPDEFVLHLLSLAPGVVAGAARDHCQSMRNPPKSIEEYLNSLEGLGMTQTVAELRDLMF